jgi:putative MFS transporter
MFERLEATRTLTANQWRIIVAAILGDMLEFFDYFLIGLSSPSSSAHGN